MQIPCCRGAPALRGGSLSRKTDEAKLQPIIAANFTIRFHQGDLFPNRPLEFVRVAVVTLLCQQKTSALVKISTPLLVRIVNLLGRMGHRSAVAVQLMFRVLQA